MKLPLDWLSEFVDVADIPHSELIGGINFKIFEVEDEQHIGVSLKGPIVCGQISQIERHPNAEKLQITQTIINSNGDSRRIVCGAKNIAVGQRVPVALPGSCVVNRKTGEHLLIGHSTIRGQESEGMLCSAEELGLVSSSDGIHILPAELPLGTDLIDKLNLKPKIVLNLGSRSNRGDALCIQGLAREVAACFGRKLKIDHFAHDWHTEFQTLIEALPNIHIAPWPEVYCSRLSLLAVQGVQIAPSPAWLSEKLLLAGVSSINNIVDITNYIMLLIGQPMHAYDRDKLPNVGEQFSLRRGNAGESFAALDGKNYTLSSENLVVTCNNAAVSLAGVMGGAHSAISESTTSIVLEAACFNPAIVRASSRASGLASESSRRFERGISPQITIMALSLASKLVSELAGGKLLAAADLMTDINSCDTNITLELADYERLIGSNMDAQRAIDILGGLGFKAEQTAENSKLKVTVPIYRSNDVKRPVDLIEELARLEGLNSIPSVPLPSCTELRSLDLPDLVSGNSVRAIAQAIRKELTALGYFEVISTSFVTEAENYTLDSSLSSIEMLNPISPENSQLRQTLLPNLIKAAKYNLNRRYRDHLTMFELGRTYGYHPQKVSAECTGSKEFDCLGLLCVPSADSTTNWQGERIPANDFYSLKGICERVISRFVSTSSDDLTFEPPAQDNQIFHPGASAVMSYRGELMGYLGRLHPKLTKSLNISVDALFAQIDLAHLPAKLPISFEQPPDVPFVQRDMTIDLPSQDKVTFAEILQIIQNPKSDNCDFDLLDTHLLGSFEHASKQLRSLTFRLIFQGKNTLSSDRVSERMEQIKARVSKLLPQAGFRE